MCVRWRSRSPGRSRVVTDFCAESHVQLIHTGMDPFYQQHGPNSHDHEAKDLVSGQKMRVTRTTGDNPQNAKHLWILDKEKKEHKPWTWLISSRIFIKNIIIQYPENVNSGYWPVFDRDGVLHTSKHHIRQSLNYVTILHAVIHMHVTYQDPGRGAQYLLHLL